MTTDPLEIFVCPISHVVMSDPVVASDGHTYERRCIEDWINLKGLDATSPKTNERLVHHHLTPNHTLKSGIADYHEAQRLAEKASQQRCQQPADTTNASIPPTPPLVGAASAVLGQPSMVPSAVSKGHVALSKIRAKTSTPKTAPSPKPTAVLTAIATTPAAAVKASSSEVQKAVGYLTAPVTPSAPPPSAPVAAVAAPAVVDHMPPLRQTRSRNESQVASYLDVVQNAAAGAEVPNMGQEQTQKVSRTKTLPKCDGDVRNHGRQVQTVSNISSTDVQQVVSGRGVVLSPALEPVPKADDSRQLDGKFPTSFISKTKAEEIPRRPLQGSTVANDPESGRVGDLVKAFRRLKQERELGLQQSVTPIASSSGGHATVASEAVQTPSIAQETREAVAIAVDAAAKIKAEQEARIKVEREAKELADKNAAAIVAQIKTEQAARTKVEREAKELADKNALATVAQVKAKQEMGEINQAKARVDVGAMMMNAHTTQAAAAAKAASDSKAAAATAKATTDKRRMAVAAAAAAVEVAAAELAARPAGERAQVLQRKGKQRKAPKPSAKDDDEDHRLLEAAQQAVRLTAQPARPANFKTLFVAIGLVVLLLSAWWCLENPPEDNKLMSSEHKTNNKLKTRDIEKLAAGTQKTKVEQALLPDPVEINIAASIGDVDLVQGLLEQGADINEAYNGFTALHTAAGSGHFTLVQYLLEQGADKEKAIDDGATPLYIAAAQGHLAVVKSLLKYGADMDKADDEGESPFFTASQNGHLPVVQYLLEQGANKDKCNNDGTSPLSIAAYAGHLGVVKYLLEQGMEKDIANNYGRTVLMFAAGKGHLDVLRYLVELGVDKDKADNSGWTALMWAVHTDHLAVVESLLVYGADRNRANNEGMSLLHTAAANGDLHIVKYLLKQGVDIDNTDNYGRTPATMALFQNHWEVFTYLDEIRQKKTKKIKKPTRAKP